MFRLCVLAFLASAFGWAQHPAIATVKTFVEATRVGDVKTLESLTASEFFEVSPLGEVDPRAKFLGFYAPSVFDVSHAPKSITVDEVNLIDHGSMAVLCWRESFAIETPAGTRSVAMRSTGVLEKTPAGWKLVSRQATSIRPPAAK